MASKSSIPGGGSIDKSPKGVKAEPIATPLWNGSAPMVHYGGGAIDPTLPQRPKKAPSQTKPGGVVVGDASSSYSGCYGNRDLSMVFPRYSY